MRFYAIIFLDGCYLGVLRLFVATFNRRLILLLELVEWYGGDGTHGVAGSRLGSEPFSERGIFSGHELLFLAGHWVNIVSVIIA